MPMFAALIYAPDSAHAPDAPPEDLAECDDHVAELLAADAMLLAYALTPRGLAKAIRVDGVTDGPFVDAREVVAGFYVIEATDLDEAVRIAATNPVARTPGGGVEVRPVHSGDVIRPPRS